LEEKAEQDCGKSNRILHTEQGPNKSEMDFPEQRGKIIEFAPPVKNPPDKHNSMATPD
jgi:hypothetical protein